MPVLFARSLAQIDPDLADALAVVPWRGGTVELEDMAIGEANAVIALRFFAHHRSHPSTCRRRQTVPQLWCSHWLLTDWPRSIARGHACADRAPHGRGRGHLRPTKLFGAANHLRGTRRSHLPRANRRTACPRTRLAAAQISKIHPLR